MEVSFLALEADQAGTRGFLEAAKRSLFNYRRGNILTSGASD
jgi:hypothetical protein